MNYEEMCASILNWAFVAPHWIREMNGIGSQYRITLSDNNSLLCGPNDFDTYAFMAGMVSENP